TAEADQAVGIALVDDETKLLDRARPVGTSCENVFDALLAVGCAMLALCLTPRALDCGQEFLLEAVLLLIFLVPVLLRSIRRSGRRLHGRADARLVAMLDHGLGLGREDLLPVERGLQRPARGEMILHAFAGIVLLDLGEPEANELVPFGAGQLVERFAGRLEMRCEWNTKLAQQLRALEAGRIDA